MVITVFAMIFHLNKCCTAVLFCDKIRSLMDVRYVISSALVVCHGTTFGLYTSGMFFTQGVLGHYTITNHGYHMHQTY